MALSPWSQYNDQSRRLIDAIKAATTGRQRQNVLKLALISFDHNKADAHDLTVRAGAIGVLIGCLHEAVHYKHDDKEVERICRLTNILLRCSRDVATTAISSSMTETVTLAIQIISSRCSMDANNSSSRAAILLWMRMCIYSISLHDILDNDRLLLTVVRAIRYSPSISDSVHHTALKFIAILAAYPDNRVVIMQFPGMVDVIMDRALNDECSLVGAECAKIIESLLCDARNRTDYIKRPRSLGMLLKHCRSLDASAVFYAVGSLKQLSLESSIRRKISGPEILAVLIRLIIIPSAPAQTKRECLQTMSNLICVFTAHHFMAYSGLLNELAKIATLHSSDQVKSLAARTIKRLSPFIQSRDAGHNEFFDALETMSISKGRLVRLWTARALVEQSLLAGSSFLMVRTPKIMSILTRLASSTYTDVKAATFEALANLAQEPANARRISMSTNILELLVRTIRESSQGGEVAGRQAVRAVLLMASNRSSTKHIAQHFGLVSCLSRYGTSADEDSELKQAALHGVVVLASLI